MNVGEIINIADTIYADLHRRLIAPIVRKSEANVEKIMSEPWAFIGHRDGYWAGVASATMPPKDLKKFVGEMVADGMSITTVYSRDEYNKVLGGMKSWSHRPDADAC